MARSVPPPLPPSYRRKEPPPLPRTRVPPLRGIQRDIDLNRLGTGANFRSHRLTWLNAPRGAMSGAPLNEWVDVVSTWVLRSRFDPGFALFGDSGTGDWQVEFLNGAEVIYHDTPVTIWTEFFNSSSKGMFIYYRCKEEGRAYELIQEGYREVTAKQRKIRDAIKNEGLRALGRKVEMSRRR